MLLYDPAVNLQHYPMSLGKYGQNPYGESLYRIVFTKSRRNLVGGLWEDNGAKEYRWCLTYDGIQEPWIMERWDTCRMSRVRWDQMVDPRSGYLLNGPYPERGEYYWCHTFTCPVADCNMDKLVSWIEEGRNRSWQDHHDACKADYDADTKERQSRVGDIVRNALPAYLDRPMAGYGGGRGTKTAWTPLSANELRMPSGKPMPLGNNKFVSVPRKRKRMTLESLR